MGWKKFFIGEKMPDMEDPKNKERYEQYVRAGERFAQVTGISWLGGRIHRIAFNHKKAFLVSVFVFVISLFLLNGYRLIRVVSSDGTHRATMTERVDSLMQLNQVTNPK